MISAYWLIPAILITSIFGFAIGILLASIQKDEIELDGLKICPYCGARAQIHELKLGTSIFYSVYCTNNECIAHILSLHSYSSKEEAIAAWNRRHL